MYVLDRVQPHVHFVVLTLNTTERAGYTADNQQRSLPSLEPFLAVNGFDVAATIAALAATPLRLHLHTFCGYARFATYGSMANFITKYEALRMQLRRRVPYLAILEDDMELQPGFAKFVTEAVRERLERPAHPPELLVLGAWGEGYVTSLAAARRVVAKLEQQGIPLTIDIMLNDGHAGRAERVRGTPWRHRVPPNAGKLRWVHRALPHSPRCPTDDESHLRPSLGHSAQHTTFLLCHSQVTVSRPSTSADTTCPNSSRSRAQAPRAA